MNIKDLKVKYAEQNHVFDDCETLRNLVNWMNNRDEHLNQNKSMNQLIREYLTEVTAD